tara:strand:- start:1831 stop:2709 length:879 start_codon:yes stop_codon:yes gene_type:complete
MRLSKKKYQPFIINLVHTFSKKETNMSFPIWFADSIISQKRVRKIVHHIYPSTTSIEQGTIPKESKSYLFNQEGEVERVEIDQFYEYVTVGSLVFDYSAKKDPYGYSPVSFVQRNKDEKVNFSEHYSIYEKIEYSEKFLVYQNEDSGDYLFYMLNRINWGALSVDSILKPTPADRIFYGNPNVIEKSYQVENTVMEFNSTSYNYDPSKKYPLEMESNHFPFRKKRTIEYDANGRCEGFVDSTFSDTKYLTRRYSRFVYDNGLPIKLVHESKSNNNENGFIQVEEFEYEFIEE